MTGDGAAGDGAAGDDAAGDGAAGDGAAGDDAAVWMLVAQSLLSDGRFGEVRRMLLGQRSLPSGADEPSTARALEDIRAGLDDDERREWDRQIALLRGALEPDRVALALGAVVGAVVTLLLLFA